MEEERMTLRVVVTQPALDIDGASETGISQEALIAFGQWFKGDKGEKGDKGDRGESWDDEFELATDEDIDSLFD